MHDWEAYFSAGITKMPPALSALALCSEFSTLWWTRGQDSPRFVFAKIAMTRLNDLIGQTAANSLQGGQVVFQGG